MARGLDRLVVELRLAGASTLEQANAVVQTYVPRFNAQFAVETTEPGLAYRPLPLGRDLDTLCCFKYVRTVALDNTVQLGEHRLQLLPDKERRSYARAHVEVHERLDGALAVYYAGRCLATTPAPLETPTLRARSRRLSSPQSQPAGVDTAPVLLPPALEVTASDTVKPTRKPAADHPWNARAVLPKGVADSGER